MATAVGKLPVVMAFSAAAAESQHRAGVLDAGHLLAGWATRAAGMPAMLMNLPVAASGLGRPDTHAEVQIRVRRPGLRSLGTTQACITWSAGHGRGATAR